MNRLQIEKLSARILLHGDGLDDGDPMGDAHDSETVETSTSMDGDHDDHSGGHGDTPHPDDPVRQAEHLALLDLVPHSQATHHAVVDGDWRDPATWDTGTVPGDDAHVLVPLGTTVVVDGELGSRLATVRVDGMLHFATDVDTRLVVDTLVVDVTGMIEIGSHANPIAADVTAAIVFTDDGPIDTVWDPTLLSRGLISHGAASIYGAAKTGPVDLATPPAAGATELLLAEPVEGWQVGDRVLVPGVERPAENNQGVTLQDQDEIVTITSISADGAVIGIDTPLVYDHLTPDARLTLPIANLDRNVTFESENTTDPTRAGHVMFMHSAEVSVNYASFDHIGRNDKSKVTTDPELDEHGVLVPGTGDNPRGRYAVHLHRTGSESVAATVTGSVVEHSPGWGFVNHDSNAVFRENVSYHVKGAGFVTEVGSERGAFIDNLAVRSTGRNYYQPLAASDKGAGDGFGSTGHGFWLQSASVAMIGNTAAGHAQEGIFINNRTFTERGRDLASYASLIDTPVGTPMSFNPNGPEPEIRDGEVRPDQAPLAEIRGNNVFASGTGIAVRWRRQEWSLAEGSDGDVIEDFQIWNVKWSGVHLGYVSSLTLRNGLILGDLDDPIAIGRKEAANRETVTTEHDSAAGRGVAANRNSRDLTYENLEIGGFAVGIQANTHANTFIDSVRLQNVENLLVVTPQSTSLENSEGARRVFASNVVNVPLSAEALGDQTPYNVRMMTQIIRAGVAGGSTPSQEFDGFTATDEVFYNGRRLYFYDQAADAVPFPTGAVPSFMNGVDYTQYVGLTNQELLDQHGVAFGAAVVPAEAYDAAESLGINGYAVDLESAPEEQQPIRFRYETPGLKPIWFLGDSESPLEWATTKLPADTTWRVYLNGPEGTHQVGRTGWASDRGDIVAGAAESGWQSWRFDWQGVGDPSSSTGSELAPGEYSIMAVVDHGPAVYLGPVLLVEMPSWFYSFGFATSFAAPAASASTAVTTPSVSVVPLEASGVVAALDAALLSEAASAAPVAQPGVSEAPLAPDELAEETTEDTIDEAFGRTRTRFVPRLLS